MHISVQEWIIAVTVEVAICGTYIRFADMWRLKAPVWLV